MRPATAALAAMLALASCACDGRRHTVAQGSITVKLPPPRPATPSPGFALEGIRTSRR